MKQTDNYQTSNTEKVTISCTKYKNNWVRGSDFCLKTNVPLTWKIRLYYNVTRMCSGQHPGKRTCEVVRMMPGG